MNLYRLTYLGGATLVVIALIFFGTATSTIYGLKALVSSQVESNSIPIIRLVARSFRIDIANLRGGAIRVASPSFQTVFFDDGGAIASVKLGRGTVRGNIDEFTSTNSGDGMLRGWAASIDGEPKPAFVLLIKQGVIVARAPVSGSRPDVATALGSDEFAFSGFSISVPQLRKVDMCSIEVAILLADATIAKLSQPANGCQVR